MCAVGTVWNVLSPPPFKWYPAALTEIPHFDLWWWGGGGRIMNAIIIVYESSYVACIQYCSYYSALFNQPGTDHQHSASRPIPVLPTPVPNSSVKRKPWPDEVNMEPPMKV